MTPKGKERLLKLAEILDVADAEHRKKKEPTYNQYYMTHKCGTPACAMGHWAANNRRRFKHDRRSATVVLHETGSINVIEMGTHEFDITLSQAINLFGSGGCDNARTAKQAARYIRRFVKRVERSQRLGMAEAA